MFKTAARKIAHNSTVPGIPGLSARQDLRALQDLINAEKAILNSLQRLSADFTRASEALKTWGMGEGDDLADTLSASTTLFLHFSSALAVFANHEVAVREHMKAVRSREEALDQLKRRRKSVFSDAEAAERKLSKMNPENKNLQQQTDLLNRLRDEIRAMDTDIMNEEAGLGDFKRSSARHWMGLKFGGLLECCEKGAIIGELGKLVVSEIPLEPAQPGLPRPYYTGHARTEFLVAEATRSIAEVLYSPDPNPNPSQRTIRPLPGPELPAIPSISQRRMSASSMGGQSGFGPTSPAPGGYPGLPEVDESGFRINQFTSQSQHPPVNEFGTISGGPISQTMSAAEKDKVSSPRGGRFATFPVKAGGPRPPPGAVGGSSISMTNPYISPAMKDGDRAPSLEIDRHDESFASSVAQALGSQFSVGDRPGNPPSHGPSASSSRFSAPQGPPPPPRDIKGDGADFGPQRYSPPPPLYTPSDSPQLPAGAAPPNPPSSFHNGHDGLSAPESSQRAGSRPQSVAEEDEGLAYMLPGERNESTESIPDNGDRRVRFGSVRDVEQELEKRYADQEAAIAAAAQRAQSPESNQGATDSQPGRRSPEVHRSSQPNSPTTEVPPPQGDRGRSPPSPSQIRIPTPPPHEQDPSDERSLNAAAAREVSRELDALMMSSPPVSPTDNAPASPSSWGTRPQYANPSFQRQLEDVSQRPSVDLPGSGQASQVSSPKLEGIYVRQRDRSAGSPISRAPPEPTPAPVSPSGSNDGSNEQRSITTIPRISPAPPSTSNGTPFRTPLESPLGPPPTGSFYNLPGTTGSNTSFSAPGGIRTISAAAFRRPVRNASGSLSAEPPQSPSLADTSPLNVKKRPLPQSPSPYPSAANLQAPGGGHSRSVSPAREQGGLSVDEQQRPLTHYHQEDDFDYISAYTDGTGGGGGGEPASPGYQQGRYATNLEDRNAIL